MKQNIKITVAAVLAFLEDIPMSASTVKYYRSCYRTISEYCQRNRIDVFSGNEAKLFFEFQMERHKREEIGLIYALTPRKAATMLADCMSGKILVWNKPRIGIMPTWYSTIFQYKMQSTYISNQNTRPIDASKTPTNATRIGVTTLVTKTSI